MKTTVVSIVGLLIAGPASALDNAARQHATDFATKAAIANMFEVEAAKIEIDRGKAGDATQFAQDMLKDHGVAGKVLSEAAKQDGVDLPIALDNEHKSKLEGLKGSDAANMDQAYLSTQVTAHQQAVKLFETYSKEGPDSQLKRIHPSRAAGFWAPRVVTSVHGDR